MITDAGPTKPQPAPECNLRKWRTNRFFQTAKVQDVKACLEEGADLNVKGMSKRTPLHFAAENGEPAVVQALLAAGADPNARDKNKETPLHLSAQYNENPLVVEALLAAGADPNAQDEGKQTPLHDAAQYNENPMVIEALLAAGADPMARDKWDDTPPGWRRKCSKYHCCRSSAPSDDRPGKATGSFQQNEDTEKRRQRRPGRTHNRRNGGRCRDCFRRQHGGHIGGRGSRGVQPAGCHEQGPTNRC